MFQRQPGLKSFSFTGIENVKSLETKKWLLLRSFEFLFSNKGKSLWAEVGLLLHDHLTETQCTAFYFLLKESMKVEQFEIPLYDNLDLKSVSESQAGGCSKPISNQVVEEQHNEGGRDTLGILRKVLLLEYEVLKISSLSGMNSSNSSPVSNLP